MTEHVVDGSVAEETGTELAHVEAHPPTTLFRTDDPAEVIVKASRVADALKGVLDRQGLTKQISGKRHVLVEGWTTLGAMVGVTAVPVWTKPLDGDAPTGRKFGYEARVEARTLDGRVIGAAEAMCTRNENRWKSADDYAIRSMAQTRATSKALREPLGFVVTLAGYDSTPADEIPHDTPAAAAAPVADDRLRPEQYQDILKGFALAGSPTDDFKAKLTEFGAPVLDSVGQRVATLTAARADELLAWLHERADNRASAA